MKREADTVVLLRLWRKRGPRPELDTMEDEGPRPYCYRYFGGRGAGGRSFIDTKKDLGEGDPSFINTVEEDWAEAVVLLILWRMKGADTVYVRHARILYS